MKVTMVPIIVGALGIVPQSLKKMQELQLRRMETIKTEALLGSVIILRNVLETWGDLLSHSFVKRHTSLNLYEKLQYHF